MLQAIEFVRLRVTFEAIDPLTFPRYKGSAIRGCFGETMRRIECSKAGIDCHLCNSKYECPVSQLFSSFVSPQHPHVRKYPKSPHPYIIDPSHDFRTTLLPGENFGFDFTLIGSAITMLPLVLETFTHMGHTGIGNGRGRFSAVKLQTLTPEQLPVDLPYFALPEPLTIAQLTTPLVSDQLTIDFENPLRLKDMGTRVESAPDFALFTKRLHQRMALLASFHCGFSWVEPLNGDHNAGSAVRILHQNTHRVDWRRYSGSQDRTMNFDGIVGEVTYQGAEINHWMPLLVLGSWLHAGSTATFGLGKYALLPA